MIHWKSVFGSCVEKENKELTNAGKKRREKNNNHDLSESYQLWYISLWLVIYVLMIWFLVKKTFQRFPKNPPNFQSTLIKNGLVFLSVAPHIVCFCSSPLPSCSCVFLNFLFLKRRKRNQKREKLQKRQRPQKGFDQREQEKRFVWSCVVCFVFFFFVCRWRDSASLVVRFAPWHCVTLAPIASGACALAVVLRAERFKIAAFCSVALRAAFSVPRTPLQLCHTTGWFAQPSITRCRRFAADWRFGVPSALLSFAAPHLPSCVCVLTQRSREAFHSIALLLWCESSFFFLPCPPTAETSVQSCNCMHVSQKKLQNDWRLFFQT